MIKDGADKHGPKTDMRVSTRQLQAFLLVAEVRSFTRAAETLHVTQAGLSSMMGSFAGGGGILR
ncbi:transcriptional regulator, LysR domain protein [Bordetella bronchiseptica OSU095]|nr:transcriptional regulator, LysR domain protein [Bordetella bronchiseptica OSU095]